jgi:hypothetical protein
MPPKIVFPYLDGKAVSGVLTSRPMLPLTLVYKNQSSPLLYGLLDSGADVNVLPYSVGIQLGAIWDEQTTELQLSGNLAKYPTRGILVDIAISALKPVTLAFAWSQSDHVPLLLGQVNFFMVFDVCFLRSQGVFEIQAHT